MSPRRGDQRKERDTLRFLNQPRPVQLLTEIRNGKPVLATLLDGERRRRIDGVEDGWVIEDEWWRQRICRRYYHLVLADGPRVTVFYDCADGGWYAQGY